MAKAKGLSAKQLDVIEDLFAGKKEKEILKTHKISRKIYDKWLADEAFNTRLDWCIQWEYRKSAFKLARSVPEAMSELMELAKSKKTETARKACIDIITMQANLVAETPSTPTDNHALPTESPGISSETAGKVLAVLAEQQQ